jgi:hypothetical protein
VHFETDGSIVVGLSDTLAILGQDGQVRPGWPSTGHASIFAVALDPAGTIYAAVGRENGKVQPQLLAFDPAGSAKAAWQPYLAPSGRWISGLNLAPDGTIYVTLSKFDHTAPDLVTALTPGGVPLASWPSSIESWVMSLNGGQAVGPDGTIYLVSSPSSGSTAASVSALNSSGIVAGWPQKMTAGFPRLLPRTDGSLLVGINGPASADVIAFSRGGQPLR